jgi:hypothetical protein
MQANTADVHFDYEGALALARQLYSLADELAGVAQRRQELTEWAKQDFSGACADQFRQRMQDESAESSKVVNGLRADAECCARLWKSAMDEENRRLYARHVDRLKAQRNVLEKVEDFFVGFQYPPEPEPVPQPQPPGFAPTAHFVKYG